MSSEKRFLDRVGHLEGIFKLRNNWVSHVTLRLPASEINLFIVELDVTLLKFPHFFNFVQVYNKALVHVV